MIDSQGVRIAANNNRVPGPVLALELVGAAIALGLLGAYLAVIGRGDHQHVRRSLGQAASGRK